MGIMLNTWNMLAKRVISDDAETHILYSQEPEALRVGSSVSKL